MPISYPCFYPFLLWAGAVASLDNSDSDVDALVLLQSNARMLVSRAARETCGSFTCPVGYTNKHSAICPEQGCNSQACCQWRPECASDRWMDFSDAVYLHDNLGGRGPDKGQEGIIIANVFPKSGRNVTMKISANDEYDPQSSVANGKYGVFVQVNVKTSTFVDLTFSFYEAATMKPIEVPSFIMTWVDFDEMKANYGREGMKFHSAAHVVLSETTQVEVHQTEEGPEYESRYHGNARNNPYNPFDMSQDHKDRSIAVVFPETHEFVVTYQVGTVPPGWVQTGRNIMFAGTSSLACPERAPCESLQCPRGYSHKRGGNITSCASLHCDLETDFETCCTVSCDGSRFHFNNALANDLAGKGPVEDDPPLMKFGNVLDGTDLVISAIVPPPYLPHNVARNGPVGNGLFSINFAVNTQVKLKFRFVKAGTDIPQEKGGFYFSVLDLDEQRKVGKGRETVTAEGISGYILRPGGSQVRVVNNSNQLKFSSSQRGTFDDNPTDLNALTQVQAERTVVFVYEMANEFVLDVDLAAGKAGRNIYFAGVVPFVAGCGVA